MEWESGSPCNSHTYPDRDAGPLEGAAAGSWSLGIVEQSQGEGSCWLQRDALRGCEGGDCGGKYLWRKAGKPWKQGNTANSHVGGGAITIASLAPHTSMAAEQQRGWPIKCLMHWTTEKDPTQGAPLGAWCTSLQSRTPAGVGGGPSMCLTCQTIEKDPRQGNPLKGLNGQSYRQRLAKEAFWSPATRGSKKRLW